MILLSPRERKTEISGYVAGKIKFKPRYFLDLNVSKIMTGKFYSPIYSFIYLKISFILEKQRIDPYLGHICSHGSQNVQQGLSPSLHCHGGKEVAYGSSLILLVGF